MTALSKLAADFGVEYDDVVQLSLATHGRFDGLPGARKARIADASLRVWRELGDDTARILYMKIRDISAPAHLKGMAA